MPCALPGLCWGSKGLTRCWGSACTRSPLCLEQTRAAPLPLQIRFVLRRGQNLQTLRLRVGVTADFNSARPRVQDNSWLSGIPVAPPKTTRNLTVGTYRGFNRVYTFDIPASQLVVGTNTITLNAVSGTAGARFLSPALSFDAIDLVQVSDYAIGTRTTPERLVPGDGDIPLRRIVDTLLDAGYTGLFDVEVIGPRIEEEGYERAIERSVTYVEGLLEPPAEDSDATSAR